MAWKPDYTTLARAKEYARIADTVDDVQLAVWITAASRAIDRKTNRQFGLEAAPVARTYRTPPTYNRRTGLWLLAVDDFQTTTGMTVNGVAYASSGSTAWPDNAALDGKPWTHLTFAYAPPIVYPGAGATNVAVARWGWTAPPAQTEAAVWLQLNRWSARRDSPLGVAGSPEQGSEVRLLSRLDPDVATTLAGLTRPRKPL